MSQSTPGTAAKPPKNQMSELRSQLISDFLVADDAREIVGREELGEGRRAGRQPGKAIRIGLLVFERRQEALRFGRWWLKLRTLGGVAVDGQHGGIALLLVVGQRLAD